MARFVTSFVDPSETRAAAMRAHEPDNAACANCRAPKPEHVCMDFRVFVCRQCSEVHAEFGHRTMSIADPEWEDCDVDLMARQGGNKRAAAEWFAFWNASEFARPQGDDQQRRRDFIRKAYVVKCWQRQPRKKRPKPPKLDGAAASLPFAPGPVPPAPGAAHSGASTGASTPTTAAEAPERDAASGSDSDGAASLEASQPAPGGRAASPRGIPLLRPPAPPAPRVALRLPPPAAAAPLQGEAWTAHFGTPRGGAGAPACAPAPGGQEAPAGAAGLAPERPALPTAPSCPASPDVAAESPLEYEWYAAAGTADDSTPEEPLTPRTRPCLQHGGGAEGPGAAARCGEAVPEKRSTLSWGAFEDRFSALGAGLGRRDDVASLEQDEVPSEFGELVQMFHDKAQQWEPRGPPAAAGGAAGGLGWL